MLPWETDPSMRGTELEAAFAEAWCAIPKVVFSRTLDSVEGNARLAEASLAEEAAAALDATNKDPLEDGCVELHRERGLEKLGMRDRVELTRYAIRRGLIEP